MQNMRDKHRAHVAQCGDSLSKEDKRSLKKQLTTRVKRVQFAAALLALLVLVVVKYLNFAITNINSLFSLFSYDLNMPLVNVIVPLGISFYTFMSIGYVIDIGRDKYRAETNFFKYALFISFFPSIVQGPISRYDDVGVQLREGHAFDYDKFTKGAQLILWGFFKKMVIADRIYPVVQTVFSDAWSDYSGSVLFFGMLAYAAQIYCDFSGGIDITRGAAQMFGIELPENFQRPYFSASVSEYWRRWHATLGSWMRDNVFYTIMLSKPVSKLSKWVRAKFGAYAGKMVPTVITPFCVFFLIGIWHGANWKYVAFGLYNATIVAGGILLTPLFQKAVKALRINTETFSWKLFQILRTFLVLGISKILVKSPGLSAALEIIKRIFTDFDFDFVFNANGAWYKLGVDQANMTVFFLALAVLFVVSLLQEKGMKVRDTLAKQNLLFRWVMYLLLLTAVLIFGIYGEGYDAAAFIYQAY